MLKQSLTLNLHGEPEGKKRDNLQDWENNIKMDFRELWYDYLEWIHLTLRYRSIMHKYV
jgi:hypothetical protein